MTKEQELLKQLMECESEDDIMKKPCDDCVLADNFNYKITLVDNPSDGELCGGSLSLPVCPCTFILQLLTNIVSEQ